MATAAVPFGDSGVLQYKACTNVAEGCGGKGRVGLCEKRSV